MLFVVWEAIKDLGSQPSPVGFQNDSFHLNPLKVRLLGGNQRGTEHPSKDDIKDDKGILTYHQG